MPRESTTQETSQAYQAIQALAYNLWLQRGCPAGSDQEDWFEAERQLKNLKQSPPRRAA